MAKPFSPTAHIRTYLLLISLGISVLAKAQFYFVDADNFYNFGFASGGNRNTLSASWQHMHIVNERKTLKLGYGLRYSSFYGAYGDFITAPAQYYDNPSELDTLTFERYRIHSLNAAFFASYALTKKLELEFNIDVVGASFSNQVDGYYNTVKRILYTDKNLIQPAKATPLNALLVARNDRGSLNSELVARYWFGRKMAFKVGAAHLITELTTNNTLYKNNNRFRNTSTMLVVGFSYSPYRL
jgi:hypothetical protein